MNESNHLEKFIDSIQYVGRMIKRNQRNQALPYDITKTQWFILRILSKEPHTIGELAKKLEVRPSSMSQMIDRLELGDFVERQTDASDARSKIVMLSDEGKKRMDAIYSKRIELLSDPFSKLSDDEQVKIVELMEKFKLNLSASFEQDINHKNK